MSRSENGSSIAPWLVAIAFFGLACVVVDLLWTHFVIDASGISEAARIHHLIAENGSEIPVFGASKARADYVPSILGPDVFNYGMDSASMDVVDALLQIECKKAKKGPIIIDMAPAAFKDVGDPSKFAPYANRPEIRSMLDRLNLMQWRYSIVGLRYFGYYDWYLKDYLAEHIALTKKTDHGFTVELNAVAFDRQTLDAAVQKRIEAGYGFSSFPDQDAILFQTIQGAPQRTFVFVYAPIHSSCFANFKNPEGFADYLDKLRSFPNVVVIDWSRMPMPDEDFRDTTHLNEKGAEAFSRLLAPRVPVRDMANKP